MSPTPDASVDSTTRSRQGATEQSSTYPARFSASVDEVVVETDPLDLPGDDPRPAFPAAPIGAAERERSPGPQRSFENGLPGTGLESMSRGIQLYRERHSARLVAGNRSWTHGLRVAAG